MNTTFSLNSYTLEKQAEIEAALIPYPEWEDFIRSPFCPFSRKEIAAIQNYRKYGRHYVTAKQFNISQGRAREILGSVVRYLQFKKHAYHDWQEFKANVRQGHFDKCSKEEIFLSLPLYGFGFSPRAYYALCVMDCECLEDVLKLDKPDLLELRRIGKKSVDEIEKVLKELDLEWGMKAFNYN